MTDAASALKDRLEEIPGPARGLAQELLAEHAALAKKASEREELVEAIAQLHSRCLELHDSEISLHTQLGNLYVSASQLSSTLSQMDVLAIVQEIVTNLIGSEAVGIFELEGSELVLRSQFGIDADRAAHVHPDNAPVDGVLRALKPFFKDLDPAAPEPLGELNACVPLRVGDRPVGLIAVFELLPQKPRLTGTDRQLLEMLGTLGGYALYCSQLHEVNPSPGCW